MRKGGKYKISFVLSQEFGRFFTVFSRARWRNLVRVECLQMIKLKVFGFCSIDVGFENIYTVSGK